MYAGHLAAGLAIKARVPATPTAAVLLGAGWLDLVHGVLVAVGVEHARPDPSKFLGWDLYDMPWTHSFAAAVGWSLLAVGVFWRRGRAVALAIGLAVLSHWLLDLPMHEHDLPLAPGSSVMLGAGLWAAPITAWLVEAAMVAACLAYYVVRARRVGTFGGRALWVCVVVAVLHASFFPGISAIHMVGVRMA